MDHITLVVAVVAVVMETMVAVQVELVVVVQV
jgi:hypothetical protein